MEGINKIDIVALLYVTTDFPQSSWERVNYFLFVKGFEQDIIQSSIFMQWKAPYSHKNIIIITM